MPYRFTMLISLILFLIVCQFFNILNAGIFMVEENGNKSYISDGRMKEINGGEGMIMDSHTGDFIYFNPGKKIFTRGKISDFCESMSKLLEQMMATMPPEYKEMFGTGQQQQPPQIEISSQGDGGVIAGYQTEKFSVKVNGEIYETIWLATDKSLIEEFRSLIGMLSEFEKCSKSMEMGSPPAELSPDYLKLMEKGLTLKSIQYESGDENMIVNTVSVEIKDIPDSEFQIPVEFKEISFMEFFSLQMEDNKEF